MKGKNDTSTIRVRHFNNPLLILDRTAGHKVNKEMGDLNKTLNQQGLTDIHKIFNTTTE